MTISVACPNGHKIKAKEKYAGKKVKCPKCDSIIRIPKPEAEAASSEPVAQADDPFGGSDDPFGDASADNNNPFDLGDPLAATPGLDDPLAVSDPLGGADPLSASDSFAQSDQTGALEDPFSSTSVPTGQTPATGGMPQTSQAASMTGGSAGFAGYGASQSQPQADSEERPEIPLLGSHSLPFLAACGSAGGVFGFLLVGLIGFFLLPDQNPPGPAIADTQPVVNPADHTPIAPVPREPVRANPKSPNPTDSTNAQKPESSSPSTPAPKPKPDDLRRIPAHERIPYLAFNLPGRTWSSAYDPRSGRLAVIHDEHGLLVYDIAKVVEGQTSPIKVWPTESMPTSVCCKYVDGHPLFVLATRNEKSLTLYHALKLEKSLEIPVDNVGVITALSGSSDSKDPYIYFRNLELTDDGSVIRDRMDRHSRLFRVSTKHRTVEGPTLGMYLDAIPFGSRIYARKREPSTTIFAPWSDLVNYEQSVTGNFPGGPPMSGNAKDLMVHYSSGIVPQTGELRGRMEFVGWGTFDKLPLVIGFLDGEDIVDNIAIGSSNSLKTLTTVPLPQGIINTKGYEARKDPRDFRFLHHFSNHPSYYLQHYGDDERKLSITVFSEQILVLPLDKVKYPREPNLAMRHRLHHDINMGEPYSYEFKVPPEFGDHQFEFVDESDPKLAGMPFGIQLKLAASVTEHQNEILLTDIDPIINEPTPVNLQLGDERMVVTDIDDYRTSVIVKRTEPVAHHVSAHVTVIPKRMEDGPNPPIIENNVLRWTPNVNQLGSHRFRIRGNFDGVTRDWFWPIRVERTNPRIPFQVAGVAAEYDGSRVVVWGASQFRDERPEWGDQPVIINYFLGVYDSASQKMLHQVQLATPIFSAAIRGNYIYACELTDSNRLPTTREEERLRSGAGKQPGKLVRFDAQTLAKDLEVQIEEQMVHLQVIADQYLTARAHWNKATMFRFHLNDLSPVEPPLILDDELTAGRIRDGWVWDAIVWDETLKSAKMLLHPLDAVRVGYTMRENRDDDLEFHVVTDACHPCFTTPQQMTLYPYHMLSHPLYAMKCKDGVLGVYDYGKLNKRDVPNFSVRLLPNHFDRYKPVYSMGPKPRNIAETQQFIYVAEGGKLFPIDKQSFIDPPDRPYIKAEQSQMHLDLNRPTTLRYTINGSENIKLSIYRDGFRESDPMLELESNDGTFKLTKEHLQKITEAKVGGRRSSDPEGDKRRAEYYRRLTGKRAQGVLKVLPVKLVAVAPDGETTTEIRHFYLLDVPAPKESPLGGSRRF